MALYALACGVMGLAVSYFGKGGGLGTVFVVMTGVLTVAPLAGAVTLHFYPGAATKLIQSLDNGDASFYYAWISQEANQAKAVIGLACAFVFLAFTVFTSFACYEDYAPAERKRRASTEEYLIMNREPGDPMSSTPNTDRQRAYIDNKWGDREQRQHDFAAVPK